MRKIWRAYRGWPMWVQIPVGIFAGFFFLGVVSAPFAEPEQKSVSTGITTTIQTRRTTTTVNKTSTSIKRAVTTTSGSPKKAAPRSTTSAAPADPRSALQSSLLKVIGKGNRKGVERLMVHSANPGLEIVLTWAIDDNLTEGLTKDGGRLETKEILEWIKVNWKRDYQGVRMEGTFALIDQYGNSSEDRVFLGTFSKDLVNRINYDIVDFKELWNLPYAPAFVHPAFKY